MAAMVTANGTAALAKPKCLIPVLEAEEIDRWWHGFVLGGVQSVIEKADGSADFLPEEVYVYLRRRAAHLYLVQLNGKVGGFTIFRKMHQPFSGSEFLLIWLGFAISKEYTDAFYRELPDLMRSLKYTKVVQETCRAGFDRKPPPGFKTALYTQVMTLD